MRDVFKGFGGLLMWLILLGEMSNLLHSIASDMSQMWQLAFLLVFFNPFTIVGGIHLWGLWKTRRAAALKLTEKCEHQVAGGATASKCGICTTRLSLKIQENTNKQLIEDTQRRIQNSADRLREDELIRLTEIRLKRHEFLTQITPREFEVSIAEMYRRLGYEVTPGPYTNDEGIDATLFKGGKKFLVQCKQYGERNPVGRVPAQNFFAAITAENAELGFLVTTSRFTQTAVDYAQKVGKIQLINAARLSNLMAEAFPEDQKGSTVRIMCRVCGEIIKFNYGNAELTGICANHHQVDNDLENAPIVLSFRSPLAKIDELPTRSKAKGRRRNRFSTYRRSRKF